MTHVMLMRKIWKTAYDINSKIKSSMNFKKWQKLCDSQRLSWTDPMLNFRTNGATEDREKCAALENAK